MNLSLSVLSGYGRLVSCGSEAFHVALFDVSCSATRFYSLLATSDNKNFNSNCITVDYKIQVSIQFYSTNYSFVNQVPISVTFKGDVKSKFCI